MMKNKLLLLLLLSAFVPMKVSAQISLTVDSLIVEKVLWISRNDIWIEDFAYGPHLRFVCSVTNNTEDTIVINLNEALSLESDTRKKLNRRIYVDYTDNDSTLSIPSRCRAQIEGDIDAWFCLDNKRTVRDNYLIVDFMPGISKLVRKSHVVIRPENQSPLKATMRNCFVGRDFFKDGTFNEPIIDIKEK